MAKSDTTTDDAAPADAPADAPAKPVKAADAIADLTARVEALEASIKETGKLVHKDIPARLRQVETAAGIR